MNRDQTVRDTAYAIWQAEGRPDGRDTEHWRLAEEHIGASAVEPDPAIQPLRSKASATAARKPKTPATLNKAATVRSARKPASRPKA